jgi:hypothetical protein
LLCQDSSTHAGKKENAVESTIEQRARKIRDFRIGAKSDFLRGRRNYWFTTIVRDELSHFAGATALQCQYPRSAESFLALFHAFQTTNARA